MLLFLTTFPSRMALDSHISPGSYSTFQIFFLLSCSLCVHFAPLHHHRDRRRAERIESRRIKRVNLAPSYDNILMERICFIFENSPTNMKSLVISFPSRSSPRLDLTLLFPPRELWNRNTLELDFWNAMKSLCSLPETHWRFSHVFF